MASRMRLLLHLGFALAYLAASEVGLLLSVRPGPFATFWPPAGLFLGALLRFPRRDWPALLATGFLANTASNLLVHDKTAAVSLAFSAVNLLSALTGAVALEWLLGGRYRHASLREVLSLFLVAAPGTALVGATLGSAMIWLTFGEPASETFRVWWAADGVGIALVAPLLLVPLPRLARLRLRTVAEAALLLSLLVLVAAVIFSARADTLPARAYPIFPLLLWAALRFQLAGVCVACPALALVALPFGVRGLGPFAIAGVSPGMQVLALQLFLFVCCLTFHVVAAVVAERARKEQQLREAAETLRASLREKETLLKEVHHRVKNNLAVIAELLSLQASRAEHSDARPHLLESRDRVWSLAAVHEMLYRSKDLSRIDLPGYVRQLCQHLLDSYLTDPGRVRVETSVAPVTLDLEQAVPFGLLLNELVSNALKHGFPGGAAGRVRVELARAPSADGPLATLVVRDDGVGLPPDLDARRARSLGLRLIDSLSRQLHGTPEIRGEGGTQFCLRFPLPAGEPTPTPIVQPSCGTAS
jgi:two-component sensor histidine kinase/integral membrane sensor domain MASE1